MHILKSIRSCFRNFEDQLVTHIVIRQGPTWWNLA